ncbi:MAG: hypothetical protein K9L17_13905, partial [Clostridiales bacterium]|nr:hypothetical protein [Clostridiales bacterium]MCF8023767.1 hypothetical protein [Clostridiales bacterium]
PSSPFGFLQTPPLASGALAYGLSSRWLGDMGFFQPTGSANMPGKQKPAIKCWSTHQILCNFIDSYSVTGKKKQEVVGV